MKTLNVAKNVAIVGTILVVLIALWPGPQIAGFVQQKQAESAVAVKAQELADFAQKAKEIGIQVDMTKFAGGNATGALLPDPADAEPDAGLQDLAPKAVPVDVIEEVLDNVLSVPELWPDWAEGSEDFSVPEGYEAWVTTDPGYLYHSGDDEPFAQFAVRTVVLIPAGAYTLDTYHSAENAVNAWMEATRIDLFTMDAPVEQAYRMHDMDGNPAPIVDLRNGSVVAAASLSTMDVEKVFVAPEVNKLPTSTTVVTEVDSPSAAPATIATAMTCVPDSESFVIGYSDPNASVVTLNASDGKWVIAGMDPAKINGQQPADKAIVIVSPSHSVILEGLGRDPANNRAYVYACELSSEPSDQMIQDWVKRESNGGRNVQVIKF